MLKNNLRDSYYTSIFKRFYYKKNPKIDHHLHTKWTDGKHSVKDMYNFYKSKNFESILFSEHSRKTSKNWFQKFSKEIRSIKYSNCIPFVGTEVKVLNLKGELDISDKIKKECDLIMASVHRFPGEKFKKKKRVHNSGLDFNKKDAIDLEFELSMSAIKNSQFDIIGHPFGMSIKRFKITPKKNAFVKLIEITKKNEKIFEINYNYHYGLVKFLIDKCLEKKCLFSIGSNSHSLQDSAKFNKRFKV